MAENSNIEWTHATFNPWRGCTKVSPGCANCYADTLSKRNPNTLGIWGRNGTRVIAAESYWRQPLKWDREAAQAGERRRVFCASLADVFEGPESMPESEWLKVKDARLRLFDLIEQTPHLDWLLLTKRPENVDYLAPWAAEWPSNVWLGTSVEDQKRADERIPHLLRIPARVRFLSCEPLLGPVDLTGIVHHVEGFEMVTDALRGVISIDGQAYLPTAGVIHWVIVGGESGGNARPMHPDWARSLRDQCSAAGVSFFMKQWGEWMPGLKSPDETFHGGWCATVPGWGKAALHGGAVHDFGDAYAAVRAGKKSAGRMLDGRTWDEFPA